MIDRDPTSRSSGGEEEAVPGPLSNVPQSFECKKRMNTQYSRYATNP